MQPATGSLLQSTAALKDTFFENSIILLTSYDTTGAVGFVINRPFARKLHELEEFRHISDFPLNDGGPVGRENLYFIHRREDLIKGGQPLGNGFYFSGDFIAAIKCINHKSLLPQDLLIFVGYCGWDAGQLEAEIAEGSWQACPSDTFLNKVSG